MSQLVFRPLTQKGPWTPSHERQPSRFSAGWEATVRDLRHEVDLISPRDTLIVLEADATDRDIRLDGGLRADAKVRSDGVAVSFDSRHGPLRYQCDRYRWGGGGFLRAWQANVRAVVLTLEALRAVDRYGAATSGEQYRGFTALPPGTPAAMTVEDAARFMAEHACMTVGEAVTFPWGPHHKGWAPILHDPAEEAAAYRLAAQVYHPDRGGDHETFVRLQEAHELLQHHHRAATSAR